MLLHFKSKQIAKTKIFLLMVLVLLMTFTSISYAEAGNQSSTTATKIDFLVDLGYPRNVIESMEESYIKEIYHLALVNPDALNISWGVLHVDNLEEIQKIVNSTDDELEKMGVSIEEIIKIRKNIEQIKCDFENGKLSEFSLEEQELLRKALEPNPNYCRKTINQLVSLSSQISSSDLVISQSVTDLSTTNPDYEVYISWRWIDPYFWTEWDDKIATSWGGNLIHDTSYYRDYAYANYYLTSGIWPGLSWSTYQGQYNHDVFDEPNKGIIWVNDQTHYSDRMRYGYQRYRIYKNTTTGDPASLVSRYFHRVLSLGDFSLSVTGGGISFGSSWDYSTQAISTIEY